MSLPLRPPLPGAEGAPPGADPLDKHADPKALARFSEQKEKIILICKALKLRFSTSRGTASDADAFVSVSTEGYSGGSWPLNKEVFRMQGETDAGWSMRKVEEELGHLKNFMPMVYRPIMSVLANEDAGDADYELLFEREKKAAEELAEVEKELAAALDSNSNLSDRGVLWIRECRAKAATKHHRAKCDLAEIEVALATLTSRLLDVELYAVYPRLYAKGKRGESMEEQYKEIHREFVQECRRLEERGGKRVRTKAMQTVADRPDAPLSLSTVKRAVAFVEAVEEEPRVERECRKTPKKTRRHTNVKGLSDEEKKQLQESTEQKKERQLREAAKRKKRLAAAAAA